MPMTMASSLSASCISRGLFVWGISTETPFWSIGVMTMKMISSTSMTSTMGVTLMLELTFLPSSRLASDMSEYPSECLKSSSAPSRTKGRNLRRFRLLAAALLEEEVDEFGGRVVHLDVEGFDLIGEVVEHHDGGDGYEESDGRGHEGFRNTACDSRETGCLLGGDLFEGVQDAGDRSEEADERGGGADGGKTTKSALQFGVGDGFGALEGTPGSFDLLT